MRRRDSGSGVLIAVVGILIIAIIALLGGTYWNNARQEATAHITDFATCKADSGSRIQESYPETCVTSDGRSFTGPTDNGVLPTGKTKTYCATGEKLCFKYPDTWKVEKDISNKVTKDYTGDLLTVTSADGELTLWFRSALTGFGGTCAPSERVNIHVLESTAIPKLKGFKDATYAYSLDKPRVARVIVPDEEGKYLANLYVSSDSQYTTVSVLNACGTFFSHLNKGRNALSGNKDESGVDHGNFNFGTHKILEYAAPTYNTLKEAKAAYSSANYQQAAAILASLYYK